MYRHFYGKYGTKYTTFYKNILRNVKSCRDRPSRAQYGPSKPSVHWHEKLPGVLMQVALLEQAEAFILHSSTSTGIHEQHGEQHMHGREWAGELIPDSQKKPDQLWGQTQAKLPTVLRQDPALLHGCDMHSLISTSGRIMQVRMSSRESNATCSCISKFYSIWTTVHVHNVYI